MRDAPDRPGSEESHGVPHISLSKDIEEMLERRIIFLEKALREVVSDISFLKGLYKELAEDHQRHLNEGGH
jgi:hypothetical protein